MVSKVGKGTTFSFRFQKTTAEAELETEILELDKGSKNIKVLVVEDIPLNQLLIEHYWMILDLSVILPKMVK
jgi:hypothetical protein